MIPNRESSATRPNADLRKTRSTLREPNSEWLAEQGLHEGVLLLGGSSLADFRLRVAQSALRGDLTPSYWSLCGILMDDGSRFLSVPLSVPDVSGVPSTNGMRECSIADYDDPKDWPNIAVVRFATDMGIVVDQAREVASRRTIVELPALMLAWLGFAWGVTGQPNPLTQSLGIPSAVFVETAHALAGVELTPGLASAASCPEAIWQAAKWWHEYYEEAPTIPVGTRSAGSIPPQGSFVIRQPKAQAGGSGS
jgi:hypothetical protein